MIRKKISYILTAYFFTKQIAFAYVVTPMLGMLDLSESRSLNFQVRNDGNKPIQVETDAYINSQDSFGNISASPTKSLLVFPPIMNIPPRSAKTMRAILLPDKDNINERQYYKILVQELPEGKSTTGEQDKNIQVNIQLMTAYHVPVYIIPKKPVFSLKLNTLKIENQKITAWLKNESNMALRIIDQEILVMIDDKWIPATPATAIKAIPILTNHTIEQSWDCSVCKNKKISAVKINGTCSYWGKFSILKNI